MAVALVGAVGTAAEVTAGTTITGTYGQSPTAGNLLVAVITRVGSTATASPTSTGATGWTRLLPTNFVTNIGTGSATACTNLVDVWYKVAAGGDAAPVFTMTLAGGTSAFAMSCTIYELSGANTAAPLHVSGTQSSGGTTSTITSTTTTTSANVTSSGGFAISCGTRERTAGTTTITYSASWTNGFNDGATSQAGHAGVAHLASPATGATASDVTSYSGTGTSSFGAGAIVVIAPAPPVAGSAPGGASVSRREVRAVWGGAYAPVPVPPKGAAPLHLVVARRAPARALWQGTAVRTVNNTAPPPSGSTQPRATVPVPRRAAARAVWRGNVIPAGLPPVPARFPAVPGFMSPGGATPGAPGQTVNGTAPLHLVIARRSAARAVWHGTTARTTNLLNGDQPGTGLVRRRAAARAVWAGTTVRTSNVTPAVSGTAPGRMVVARRSAARGVWHGVTARTTNLLAGSQPGGLIRRRAAARGVWGGQSTPQPHVPGSVQPRATIPVPRRAAARALWQAALGALNAHGPSGSAQPRAAVPVPRRAAARVLWHGAAGPANAHGPAGAAPGGLTARRPHPRAVWRGTTVVTVNNTVIPPGTAPLHLVVARRAPARASARWTPVATVNAPPVTAAVPAPRPVIPRRVPSRAVVRGNLVPGVRGRAATGGEITRRAPSRAVTRGGPAPFPPPSGTVQPPATAPARRHQPSRVVWRGTAVPGQQPRPATGGLVRRRGTARGQWHGNTGTAPPPVPSGTPATGGRVATRRPPNRGQWRGTVTRTANAHGPGGSVQPKPVVARRTAARAWWRGSAPQAGYPASRVRFTVPYARHLWSAGTARQLWSAGTARQLWSVPSARNGS